LTLANAVILSSRAKARLCRYAILHVTHSAEVLTVPKYLQCRSRIFESNLRGISIELLRIESRVIVVGNLMDAYTPLWYGLLAASFRSAHSNSILSNVIFAGPESVKSQVNVKTADVVDAADIKRFHRWPAHFRRAKNPTLRPTRYGCRRTAQGRCQTLPAPILPGDHGSPAAMRQTTGGGELHAHEAVSRSLATRRRRRSSHPQCGRRRQSG
jgi:hypothetical protein